MWPVPRFAWAPPALPVRIHLAFDLMDRLRAEGEGLLLGVAQRGEKLVVRVDEAVAVSAGAWEEALAEWAPSPAREVYAVGYYRIQRGQSLRLGEEDATLLTTCFADSSKVVLVVDLGKQGPPQAGFFFWEGDKVRSDATYLAFPWERPAPPPAPETRPAEIALPAFLRLQEKPAARRFRLPRWAHLLTVLALAWAGLWLGFMAAIQYHARTTRPPPRDPYALELKVEEYGDNLHLKWNRNAPALAQAQRGLLVIADGEQNRMLELGQTELRSGSLVYQRTGPAVRFRLELTLPGNRTLSESWTAPNRR